MLQLSVVVSAVPYRSPGGGAGVEPRWRRFVLPFARAEWSVCFGGRIPNLVRRTLSVAPLALAAGGGGSRPGAAWLAAARHALYLWYDR